MIINQGKRTLAEEHTHLCLCMDLNAARLKINNGKNGDGSVSQGGRKMQNDQKHNRDIRETLG